MKKEHQKKDHTDAIIASIVITLVVSLIVFGMLFYHLGYEQNTKDIKEAADAAKLQARLDNAPLSDTTAYKDGLARQSFIFMFGIALCLTGAGIMFAGLFHGTKKDP